MDWDSRVFPSAAGSFTREQGRITPNLTKRWGQVPVRIHLRKSSHFPRFNSPGNRNLEECQRKADIR